MAGARAEPPSAAVAAACTDGARVGLSVGQVVRDSRPREPSLSPVACGSCQLMPLGTLFNIPRRWNYSLKPRVSDGSKMYEDAYGAPRHGSSEEEDDVAYLAPPCPISPGLRAQTLKCVNTLSGHHSGIRVIAVATNRVYTGSYDNTIKVWNLDNGRCEATLEGHVAWIRALFVHAREPLLFSGSDDGIIKIWSLDTYVHLYDILPADGDRSQTGVLALTVDYDHNWCAPPPPSVCDGPCRTRPPHAPAARSHAHRARSRASNRQ